VSISGRQEAYEWAVRNTLFKNALRVGVVAPDVSIFSHLSKQLTWLTFTSTFPFKDEHMLLLPDTLQFLQIRCGGSPYLTDECIPALPRDIREVHFLECFNVRAMQYPLPMKIDTLTIGPTDSTPPLRPQYPPYLTSLSLHSAFISEQALQVMPWFITTLVVESAVLSNTCAYLLPKYLLSLRALRFEIEDDGVASLPRGLVNFDAREGAKSLSDESAADWPPLIQRLVIPGNLFSIEGMKQLPRTLTLIHMPSASLVAVEEGKRLQDYLGPHIRRLHVGIHRL